MAASRKAIDRAKLTDDVTVELNPDPTPLDLPEGVKGPDPEVWGAHDERLAADVQAGKIDPPVDGVDVKGPDPAVWGG